MEDVFDELEEEGLSHEQAAHQGQVIEVAEAVDSLLTNCNVTNFVVVAALNMIFRHAIAQMYATTFGQPELHDVIAKAIEPEFNRMNTESMRIATELAFMVDADGYLPN